LDQIGSWAPAAPGPRPIQGGSCVPAACVGLQSDPHHQPAQSQEPAGGDGMKAPLKGPAALETRTEAGQTSLEAVDASRREPPNLIEAPSMAVMREVKIVVAPTFSAAS